MLFLSEIQRISTKNKFPLSLKAGSVPRRDPALPLPPASRDVKSPPLRDLPGEAEVGCAGWLLGTPGEREGTAQAEGH